MFAAIREKLVGAWVKLRQGSLAKLFVFEFVVVMLGVLAAQWVAEWASDRAAMAAMEERREAIDEEIVEFLNVSDGWALASQCIDTRMSDIMRALANGEPIASALVQRPGFSQAEVEMMDSELRVLVARRYGTEKADSYKYLARSAERLLDRTTRMIYAWQALAQVDPENGPASEADRQIARQGASAIKTLSQSISINVDIANLDAARGEFERNSTLKAGTWQTCDEIWRSGQTHDRGNA